MWVKICLCCLFVFIHHSKKQKSAHLQHYFLVSGPRCWMCICLGDIFYIPGIRGGLRLVPADAPFQWPSPAIYWADHVYRAVPNTPQELFESWRCADCGCIHRLCNWQLAGVPAWLHARVRHFKTILHCYANIMLVFCFALAIYCGSRRYSFFTYCHKVVVH